MSKSEIMMPVIAMCSDCVNCPDLDIGISQQEIVAGVEDEGFSMTRTFKNTIYCKRYERCKLVLNTVIKKQNKES